MPATVLEAIREKQAFCHFSVDDVFRVFNKKSGAFKFLRELYEEFGVTTSLHVFSQPQRKKILPRIPGASFKDCPWLKFGPHASDWKYPLNTQTAKEQISEVNHVYKEIGRIAGKKSFVKSLRLHFFQGSKDACLLLAKKGVEVLFTTDFFRDRFGYYLPPDSRTDLNSRGHYFDDGTKILFVKSSFRVEFRDDIIKDTKEYLKKHGFCVFYTHEEFLTDPVMQKRIKAVLAFCQKKNIPFVV